MEVRRLLWDVHNVRHIARHGVSPRDAEEVVFDRATNGPFHDERRRPGRLVFIGYSADRQALVVVVDRPAANGDAYVVTARPATDREQKRFLEGS